MVSHHLPIGGDLALICCGSKLEGNGELSWLGTLYQELHKWMLGLQCI